MDELQALETLGRYAATFPSQGGTEIGEWLLRYSSFLPQGSTIVEMGSWLGAGTACLAVGSLLSHSEVHVFDRFVCVNEKEQTKARERGGLDFQIGASTLEHVRAKLEPIGANIHFHQGSIGQAFKWNHGKIGLYVDDLTKTDRIWLPVIAELKPYFIPRETILVLMDYFFYETAGDAYAAQKRYVEARQDEFELMEERIGGTTTAVFRWLGKK